MLAAKSASLSFSFHSFSLSLLIFHLVRDKKVEDNIDSMECGRQRLRQGEKPVLIAIPSVCIEQRVSSDRLCGWGGVEVGVGVGGIWCALALGLSGNNHGRGERDELRERGRKG